MMIVLKKHIKVSGSSKFSVLTILKANLKFHTLNTSLMVLDEIFTTLTSKNPALELWKSMKEIMINASHDASTFCGHPALILKPVFNALFESILKYEYNHKHTAIFFGKIITYRQFIDNNLNLKIFNRKNSMIYLLNFENY